MSAPTTSMPVVRAAHLSVAYASAVVLRDVNLEIHPGEIWCLLGGNGEGKTTFVRAILGLVPAAGGDLEVRTGAGGKSAVGFVPQRCDLNPTLPTTLREFVSLGLVGLRLRGADERRQRLLWSLRMVGLEDLAAADYWALSGGQRQRALVARALVRKPLLLLLDEPTTGLDPTAERALLELLRELNRSEGLTIVLVTHDVPMAAQYATHVALFHGGSVISGATANVLTDENLGRVFNTGVSLLAAGRAAHGISRLGGHH